MFIEDDIKVGMLFHIGGPEDYYYKIKSLSKGPCIIIREDDYTIQVMRSNLLSFLNNGNFQKL